MLNNVINVGKDIATKISNKILNLSEIEAKIKEATSDEPWGPHASLMKEISEETFSSMNFNEIMTFLWYRIFTERPANSRRIYKGLVLLNYILLNGSDYVAKRCKDHIDDVRRLDNYSDPNGKSDPSIRKKASDISDLLSDPHRLKLEREKSKTNQTRLYGQRTTSCTDYTEGDGRPTRTQNLGDFDSWEPKSKSIPYVIGESFVNFVNTFTQNISGPPPTETHDNFDLPSYDYIDATEDVPPPKPSKVVKEVTRRTIPEPKPAPIVPVAHAVVDEAPIIDFSDPAPPAFDSVFLGDLSKTYDIVTEEAAVIFTCSDFAVKVQEDDFGDFSGWDSPVTKVPERTAVPPPNNDFFPNFDSLARTQAKAHGAQETSPRPISTIPDGEKGDSPQKGGGPGRKLGSTWNDMGSLKIDLDNVCGTRRPMYSSS